MAGRDWPAWHRAYDEPDSPLARRLQVVRDRIAAVLDDAPPGPLRAISMCAGEARDLLPVLASHPRGPDVSARLVGLDPGIADTARRSAAALKLPGKGPNRRPGPSARRTGTAAPSSAAAA